MMDEFSFIRSIQPKFYRQASVMKGISDDAAVIRPLDGDFVTAVDTMVEGVHFTRETMDPEHIGWRVLAANLSDLAAMGSTPRFYMVSITIPKSWSEQELQAVYQGMKRLADLYDVDLIGGDTVSGQELSLTVTVIGSVSKDKARYRSHAQAGDLLFVTGTLGDSRGGLEYLLTGSTASSDGLDYLIQRHRTPEPRITFASSLASLNRMALNDVSDGIASEANEIAAASHMDLIIDPEVVPYSKALERCYPGHYQAWMFSGGEDFELLGTVPEKDWAVVEKTAESVGVRVTRIGYVEHMRSDSPSVWLAKDGGRERLDASGYTHLKEEGE